MDEAVKKWWLTMSEARLREHLSYKMKYPPLIVADLVEAVNRIKSENRKKKIKQSVGRNLWDDFLQAPRYELGVVRVLKSQLKKADGVDTAKWRALCEYEASISQTIERIKGKARMLGATPITLPQRMHKEGHSLPRRKGEHWTDYVKQSEIQRITEMFTRLPPAVRGKSKTPYAKTLPPAVYKHKRFALTEQIVQEIESTELELVVLGNNGDPDEIERLEGLLARLHEAQYLLDTHKKNTPLPNTWHGLVQTRD